ncbi:hypothetical protein AC578_5216 [Pseudocercospora eumusae]|uniref:Uncharacterized protein n=1 Tax=Pseudocercospora eumusae TaxID=321146 RepID=A0A139HDR4_9PEZI|nr:hypothetical protein AC578_5216 [Pseudocercospora eumusae]
MAVMNKQGVQWGYVVVSNLLLRNKSVQAKLDCELSMAEQKADTIKLSLTQRPFSLLSFCNVSWPSFAPKSDTTATARGIASTNMAPSITQSKAQPAVSVTVTETDSVLTTETLIADSSLFEQLPKSTQEQIEDAALELSDRMTSKISRHRVTPTDLIPMSMALARMSSLLCMIGEFISKKPSASEHGKRPKAKTLASKILSKNEKAGPYKVECRCAMAQWFRVLDQEIYAAFPAAMETENLSPDMQAAIVAQMTTEVEKANAVLELWMATPEERKKRKNSTTFTASWKTSLPVRNGKAFVKEIMEKTAKRWRVPGKASLA